MATIPEDVKNFRADPDSMRRLLVALAATATVMLTITAHTMAYQDEVNEEKARQSDRVPAFRSCLII